MKSLVATGPKKTAVIEEDIPELASENDVLVKLKYCGICMSEHYGWEHAKQGARFGHEPVGVVAKVGKNVTRCKVGDRVSGLFHGSSEYTVADQSQVFVIPDNITDEEAILEPLACLFSAVGKVRIDSIGETVAVVGCGYMGCGAISLLKKRGCYVVAVDILRESLENAKKYGADEVYLPDELPEHYFDIPGSGLNFEGKGAGFRLVMEWGETNESLGLAIRMTKMCGQLAIGAYHTGEKRLVDMQMLNVKAIDCLSTHPRETDKSITGCENALKMMADGSWCFKHVPTKVYPLSQFDLAHEELKTKFGKYLKAVVDFERDGFEPYIIE